MILRELSLFFVFLAIDMQKIAKLFGANTLFL